MARADRRSPARSGTADAGRSVCSWADFVHSRESTASSLKTPPARSVRAVLWPSIRVLPGGRCPAPSGAAVLSETPGHVESRKAHQTLRRRHRARFARPHVEPGEVFCLLGANGAGKTTTINLFLNFVAADVRHGAHQRARRRRGSRSRRRSYLAYIPETGDALPQPHGAREPRVLQRAGRADPTTRAISCWLLPTRSACRPMRPTGASGPTRRACGRRSASRSRWRRRPRRCCSTSRRRASIPKASNEFSGTARGS